MKVFFTIWILAVIIQEVVPGTLVRLPRNALNRKSSVQTEYEAKYEKQGQHGHQSYSTVTGKQEIVHDDCGENWNAFAEKCATLIKDLIGSLAAAVKSNPGDATNLQLHIKNHFKHFDNTHNCSCLSHTEKGLKDLDLSPLFNNITITTSCASNPPPQVLCKQPEAVAPCGTHSASPNTNKVLAMPQNAGVNPEDADSCGEDVTTNNRREVPISSAGSIVPPSASPNNIPSQTPSATQSSPVGSKTPSPVLNNNIDRNNIFPAIEPREDHPAETQPQHTLGNSYTSKLFPNDNAVGSVNGYPQGGAHSQIPGSENANEPSPVITQVPETNGNNGPVYQSSNKPVPPTTPWSQVAGPNDQSITSPEENCDNSESGAPGASPVEPTGQTTSPTSNGIATAPQQTISPTAPGSTSQGAVNPVFSKNGLTKPPVGDGNNPLVQSPSALPSDSQQPIAPESPETAPPVSQGPASPVNSIPPETPALGTPGLTQKPTTSVTSEPAPGLPQQPAHQVVPELQPTASGIPSPEGDCDDAAPVPQTPSTLPTAPQNSVAPTGVETPSTPTQESLNPVAPGTVASGTPDQENCEDSEPSGVVPGFSQPSLSPRAPENGQVPPFLSQKSPQQPANSFAPSSQNVPLSKPDLTEHPEIPQNTAPGVVPTESLVSSPNTPTSPQQSLSPIPSESVVSAPQQTINPVSPENPSEESCETPGALPEGSTAPVKQTNTLKPETPQTPAIGTTQDSSAPVQTGPDAPQQPLSPVASGTLSGGQTPVNPDFSQTPVDPGFSQSPVVPSFGQSPISPDFSQSSVNPELVQSSHSPGAPEEVPGTPKNPVIHSPTAVDSAPPLTSANHKYEPTTSGNGGEDCDESKPNGGSPNNHGQLGSPNIPIKGSPASPSTNGPIHSTGPLGSPNEPTTSVPQAPTSCEPLSIGQGPKYPLSPSGPAPQTPTSSGPLGTGQGSNDALAPTDSVPEGPTGPQGTGQSPNDALVPTSSVPQGPTSSGPLGTGQSPNPPLTPSGSVPEGPTGPQGTGQSPNHPLTPSGSVPEGPTGPQCTGQGSKYPLAPTDSVPQEPTGPQGSNDALSPTSSVPQGPTSSGPLGTGQSPNHQLAPNGFVSEGPTGPLGTGQGPNGPLAPTNSVPQAPTSSGPLGIGQGPNDALSPSGFVPQEPTSSGPLGTGQGPNGPLTPNGFVPQGPTEPQGTGQGPNGPLAPNGFVSEGPTGPLGTGQGPNGPLAPTNSVPQEPTSSGPLGTGLGPNDALAPTGSVPHGPTSSGPLGTGQGPNGPLTPNGFVPQGPNGPLAPTNSVPQAPTSSGPLGIGQGPNDALSPSGFVPQEPTYSGPQGTGQSPNSPLAPTSTVPQAPTASGPLGGGQSPDVPLTPNGFVPQRPASSGPLGTGQGPNDALAPNGFVPQGPTSSKPLGSDHAPEITPAIKPVNTITNGNNGPLQPSAFPETAPGAPKIPGSGPVESHYPLGSSNQIGQPGSNNIPPTSAAYPPSVGVSEPVAPLDSKNHISPNQPQPVFPTAPSVPVDSLEEDEYLRPTTYQTTSVEPTKPQSPSILTIPLTHTASPHSVGNGSPYGHSTLPHSYPKHTEPGHEGDEEDEDCCSCESCTEEITNPNEYRANACKDLEDARRELKVIFDKIKKRLKCGKKFKPIPTTPREA